MIFNLEFSQVGDFIESVVKTLDTYPVGATFLLVAIAMAIYWHRKKP